MLSRAMGSAAIRVVTLEAPTSVLATVLPELEGVSATTATDAEAALERCRRHADEVVLVVDLDASGPAALGLALAVRGDRTLAGVGIVGVARELALAPPGGAIFDEMVAAADVGTGLSVAIAQALRARRRTELALPRIIAGPGDELRIGRRVAAVVLEVTPAHLVVEIGGRQFRLAHAWVVETVDGHLTIEVERVDDEIRAALSAH